MKKNILYITILAVMGALFFACEPMVMDKPDIGATPSVSDLSFTISPGSDAFHFVITNTSSITGIASWDFGNSSKGSGDEVTTTYSIAGTYTIKLTLVTKGGTASITKEFEQTETDYSIFTDPVYINLSGGVDSTSGKKWVLDSLQVGHFGVGPAGGNWPEWWGASVKQKSNGGCYDDIFVFNIDKFVFTNVNHGNNYASQGIANQPYYSNPVPVDGSDVRVTYNPTPGTWTVTTEGEVKYLILSGTTPLYFGFDNGIVNGKYRIDELTENLLKVSGIGFDGNRWYYQLIPKGYVKPTITFNVNATEGTDNDVASSLTSFSIPNGQSVTDVTWSFGDGSAVYSTTNKDEVVHHTFIRKGTYTITAKVNTSLGLLTKTKSISLANNNSTYVEYLLNEIVMYNDFGETQLAPLTGESGNCVVTLTANPNKIYPNKSTNVAKLVKTNSQYDGARITLPTGYRFDLTLQKTFTVLVYGTAGQRLMLNLINTDKGGDAWKTGTNDFDYTIKKSNTWEVATFNLSGVGTNPWGGDPSILSSDVTTDPRYNQNFYNVLRLTLNNGDGSGVFTMYVDDITGPHVEGLKK